MYVFLPEDCVDFELRFINKEISAWGGMGLMKQMLDRIGFNTAVESCGLPQPGSNRGYAPSLIWKWNEISWRAKGRCCSGCGQWF